MSKRKLKPYAKRRPLELAKHHDLMKEVSENTGYAFTNVKEVFDEYFKLVRRSLLDIKRVKISGVGEIYPIVLPPRTVVNMGGIDCHDYNLMTMEPKWKVIYKPNKGLSQEIKNLIVSNKDLDNIYYD